MPDAALVLLAGGSGSRAGHRINKVFVPLAGRRVLTWSLDCTAGVSGIGPVVVVVRDEDMATARSVLAAESPRRTVRLVRGGASRHGSERNALRALASDVCAGAVDVVVMHDAARPLAPAALFDDVIRTARAHGGAVPGRRLTGLLQRSDLRPSRADAVTVQTPQAFRAPALLAAYEAADRAGFDGSDTAACMERFGEGVAVRFVAGPATNIKITFAEDLDLAEALLARSRSGS